MKFIEGMEKMQEYIQRTKKHFYLLGVLDASKVNWKNVYVVIL